MGPPRFELELLPPQGRRMPSYPTGPLGQIKYPIHMIPIQKLIPPCRIGKLYYLLRNQQHTYGPDTYYGACCRDNHLDKFHPSTN